MSIRAEDQPEQALSAPVAQIEERRVFICYPRSALKDVATFHDALSERLKNLRREYKIFRDKGPGEGEHIVAGLPWKQYLLQKLDGSRCCLIVLVPAIFESSECADEVEYFQKKMAEEAEDTRRFFYPIIFIPLIGEESVEAQAKSGNRIAQAIKDLHNDEFLLGWSDAGTPAYQNRVNDIAKAIHGQFVSKSGAKSGALGSMRLIGQGAVSRPSWFSRRALIGFVAAFAILAGGIMYGLRPRPTLPTFSPGSAPIELVVSTQSFAEPDENAPVLGSLGPTVLKAGTDGVRSVGVAEIDGQEWYRVEFENGSTQYFPKSAVPEWKTANRNLEIVKSIEALAAPQKNAKLAGSLAEGELARRWQYGEVRQGLVAGESWFRVPQRQGPDVFFSEVENSNKLADWVPFENCLRVKAEGVWSTRSPIGSDPFNSSFNGQPIGEKGKIQTAKIDGQQWFRFTEGSSSTYGYLSDKDVDSTPCKATSVAH